MEDDGITLKSLALWSFAGLAIVLILFLCQRGNSGTKIVFCDVGQGNAAYLRIANRIDLIVDAGPDRSMLRCLGKHMPFYDRAIELVIITHPDSDHYGGLLYLIGRYEVGEIVIGHTNKPDKTLKTLEKMVLEADIPITSRVEGDKIKLADGLILFHWPSVDFSQTTANQTGYILSYIEGDFRLLFTGDSTPETLNRLSGRDISGTNILAVPHHGSKNGLTEKFLRLADPRIAVISVGKNNRFGHPHKSTLDLIKAKNIKLLRTDEDGDIKLIL